MNKARGFNISVVFVILNVRDDDIKKKEIDITYFENGKNFKRVPLSILPTPGVGACPVVGDLKFLLLLVLPLLVQFEVGREREKNPRPISIGRPACAPRRG